MKSLYEIKLALSRLRIIDLNSKDASELIEKIVSENIGEIALPNKIFEPGLKLHRCRNNNNNIDFETVDSLSFRTDPENINDYGRANKRNQSIFYGSDVRPTAILETSPVFRGEAFNDIESFSITTGHWESIKSLKLVLIVSNTNAQEKNELIRQYSIDIDEFTKAIFKEESDKVFEVLNFISSEFAINSNGNSSLYKLSCAFANYAYQMSDGLLYPSLQRQYEGLNFAIKPESAKEKLRLVSATCDKFIKISNKQFQHSETKDTVEINNNFIIWGQPRKILEAPQKNN